jgi:hypothetical protein
MFKKGLMNLRVKLFLYLIEKLIIIAIKVQRTAESIDSKMVLIDIEKNCLSRKPEFQLRVQFKISRIGKIKPINNGRKQTKKHAMELIGGKLLTGVGLKLDAMVE